MSLFIPVSSACYFRDLHAVVSRGEPCPFVYAAGVDPAAQSTAGALIDLLPGHAENLPITVTGTPENRALVGGIIFDIPGRAYALCAADRTLFIDLADVRHPLYDLAVDELAKKLLALSVGREPASSQWALVDGEGGIRELREISELRNAAAGDIRVSRILDQAQSWADARDCEPIGLSLPRLALEWVEDEPLGVIVDYGVITHAVTTDEVVAVPAKGD